MERVTMYAPKHLRRWITQVNYDGQEFHDYYVAAWRFFRCTPVERVNYQYIREHMSDCGAEGAQVLFTDFTDDVMSTRHYVLVHQDFDRGLKMADMFAERVRRKGSLDPEGEHQLDAAGVLRSWQSTGLLGKMVLCREAGVSIFAARRKAPPAGTTALLSEVL